MKRRNHFCLKKLRNIIHEYFREISSTLYSVSNSVAIAFSKTYKVDRKNNHIFLYIEI